MFDRLVEAAKTRPWLHIVLVLGVMALFAAVFFPIVLAMAYLQAHALYVALAFLFIAAGFKLRNDLKKKRSESQDS